MRHLSYIHEGRKGSKKSSVRERKETLVENKHDQSMQHTCMKIQLNPNVLNNSYTLIKKIAATK